MKTGSFSDKKPLKEEDKEKVAERQQEQGNEKKKKMCSAQFGIKLCLFKCKIQ